MAARNDPDFAGLLRRYRRRNRLTQEELAERAGLSAASVSLLERGITTAPQRATVITLSDALDLTPDEASAFMEMARGAHLSASDARPQAAVEAPLDGNLPLPLPLTALIGRAREEAMLMQLLGRETTRLLTLTGPAGVGKTRLALELAATVQHERSRDVVFVGLIPVQEPERVLPAIAQALDVRESDSVPLREAILTALQARQVLLVLDNFEQVLPAARTVLELLIARPRVKALVTSRSALNVRGEQSFPISPLALPNTEQMASLDELRQTPTVALFLDRASAVAPDFSIQTLAEGHLVADICARLDGLPLAIELAAARVRHFGLPQLLERLAEPAFLGVLAEGPQDLADHQRTMQSTIAWSYDLLGEAEQRLFRWLGVFVGGASVGAMEAVVGMQDDALQASLATLVNASLLQWSDAAGIRRYSQLVTLRAYAGERLRASGEWEDAQQRHADYFLELAKQSFSANWDQLEKEMARVVADYENIRAALTWALETGAILHGLQMVAALRRFWDSHSYFLEGLDWLERFITRFGTPQNQEEQATLAEAWTGVLVMSHRLNRFERAQAAGETALALRRAVGDKVQIAYATMNLANPIAELHDYDRARALYEECIALHNETDNRAGQVFAFLNLGDLYAATGDSLTALSFYEQSIAISREVGESNFARGFTWNSIGAAYLVLDEPAHTIELIEPSYQLFTRERTDFFAATCAFTLGRATWRLGDVAAALSYLDEAAYLLRKLGNLNTVSHILYFRASIAIEQGDIVAARHDLSQALEDLSGQSREREDIWWLVERGATLALRQHVPELAASLYGAAIAHRDAIPALLEPAEREMRERDLNELRATLGEVALGAALAAGEHLSHDEALAALRHMLGTSGLS